MMYVCLCAFVVWVDCAYTVHAWQPVRVGVEHNLGLYPISAEKSLKNRSPLSSSLKRQWSLFKYRCETLTKHCRLRLQTKQLPQALSPYHNYLLFAAHHLKVTWRSRTISVTMVTSLFWVKVVLLFTAYRLSPPSPWLHLLPSAAVNQSHSSDLTSLAGGQWAGLSLWHHDQIVWDQLPLWILSGKSEIPKFTQIWFEDCLSWDHLILHEYTVGLLIHPAICMSMYTKYVYKIINSILIWHLIYSIADANPHSTHWNLYTWPDSESVLMRQLFCIDLVFNTY